MSWTDERIDLLQKLWLQGMSASRIANELANGLTRNAVIGKVYRLGLSGRTKSATASPPAPRSQPKAPPRAPDARHTSCIAPNSGASNPVAASPIVHGNTALALKPAVFEAPAPAPNAEVVVAMSEPVTIAELRESMCRWPIGDPTQSEFRFCGAKKLPGVGPYCCHHAGIAYIPQNERRRERRVQKTA
jgi:GcrA cell cycle regulator